MPPGSNCAVVVWRFCGRGRLARETSPARDTIARCMSKWRSGRPGPRLGLSQRSVSDSFAREITRRGFIAKVGQGLAVANLAGTLLKSAEAREMPDPPGKKLGWAELCSAGQPRAAVPTWSSPDCPGGRKPERWIYLDNSELHCLRLRVLWYKSLTTKTNRPVTPQNGRSAEFFHKFFR